MGLTLYPPETGPPLPPPPTGVQVPAGVPPDAGMGQAVGGPTGLPQLPAVIPLPPPLPYASDPAGSYTELWARQTSSNTGFKMEEQVDYTKVLVNFGRIVDDITSAADWIGFLMVFKGNVVVSLLYSLVHFRTGLGTASPGNGRTFGLVSKWVGLGTAPIIMVPSTGGLAAWVRPIKLHEPLETDIETLRDSADRAIPKLMMQGDQTRDEDCHQIQWLLQGIFICGSVVI